jgi:hypothetical protein
MDVGPSLSFGRYLVILNYFGTSIAVEGGSQDGAEIMGSWPTFGSILGFWEYVMGLGYWPMGFTHA